LNAGERKTIAMLELRPSCGTCNEALPPDSTDAMICTFECNFCRFWVEAVLENVYPNCGGGFFPRPIRPKLDRKGGHNRGAYPASVMVRYRAVDQTLHMRFGEFIKSILAELR
jgi:hypothetical protein